MLSGKDIQNMNYIKHNLIIQVTPIKVNIGCNYIVFFWWVIKMKFERIRNLREDRDLKQTDLAKQLCITQATYSDYESGVINIPVEAIMKIADFYGTSVDYILGRTNVKESYPKNQQS